MNLVSEDLTTTSKVLDESTQYLEGPNSRGSEFGFAFNSFLQFIKGFRKLHFVGPCISVFGSARFKEIHPYYKMAYNMGKKIADAGFTVMTGGGPGAMEAANRGAYENGGKSVGCAIKLPNEQIINSYLHEWVELRYFFVRKTLLLKYSYAFIVVPGGFGTLDELFETITLIQTGILHQFPVVIMGKQYYQPIQEMIVNMGNERTISEKDLNLVKFADDCDDAMDHILKYINKTYKIKQKQKPWWILGEKSI